MRNFLTYHIIDLLFIIIYFPWQLYKDIIPHFNKFIHVYGWNLSILWHQLKNWTPKTFTIANLGHPVSKSWLRPSSSLAADPKATTPIHGSPPPASPLPCLVITTFCRLASQLSGPATHSSSHSNTSPNPFTCPDALLHSKHGINVLAIHDWNLHCKHSNCMGHVFPAAAAGDALYQLPGLFVGIFLRSVASSWDMIWHQLKMFSLSTRSIGLLYWCPLSPYIRKITQLPLFPHYTTCIITHINVLNELNENSL